MAGTDLRDDMVRLVGTPRDVGRAAGTVSASAIRRDVALFNRLVAAGAVTPDELRRRVDRYQSIVEQVAPHWMEEMEGIALAAGVGVDEYTAHVAQKYVVKAHQSCQPPHECTSFLASGGVTMDGRPVLHKNRDSVVRAQGVWIRSIAGTHRYLGGGDASDHGIVHFVNEHGLAGAMNAGSPSDEVSADGLPTPQVLRLIAERAATCADALAIPEEIVREGWYTNGENGSIWLFASPDRCLIVENTARRIDHRWIDDAIDVRANDFFLPATRPLARADASTNPRYVTARRGVQHLDGAGLIPAFHHLSRDTSTAGQQICGERTISGFTGVSDRQRPGLLSMAWIALGNPNNSLYIPFFVGADGVPACAVDGSLWELSARPGSAHPCEGHPALDIDGFEDEIARELPSVVHQALDLADECTVADAATHLAEASANWVRRAVSRLDMAWDEGRVRQPQG